MRTLIKLWIKPELKTRTSSKQKPHSKCAVRSLRKSLNLQNKVLHMIHDSIKVIRVQKYLISHRFLTRHNVIKPALLINRHRLLPFVDCLVLINDNRWLHPLLYVIGPKSNFTDLLGSDCHFTLGLNNQNKPEIHFSCYYQNLLLLLSKGYDLIKYMQSIF